MVDLKHFVKVGFTGTRNKLSPNQTLALSSIIFGLDSMREFHHGDCVGADEHACKLACFVPDESYLAAENHVHHGPVGQHPELKANTSKWSTTTAPKTVDYPPKTYFARNRDIVDATEVLIGCFRTMVDESGGTFYTINYALKVGRPIVIVRPNGTVTYENFKEHQWLTKQS